MSPNASITPTATLVSAVYVEDGSVLHGGTDPAAEIGEGAAIAHRCVVHGAES